MATAVIECMDDGAPNAGNKLPMRMSATDTCEWLLGMQLVTVCCAMV